MKLQKSDLQLESLASRINAQEIDLQPDFQRGEVWDKKRRQRLVDTILREWYVPAVHIVVDSTGLELVLDGQQRLAAIRDFIADDIKVDGNIEPLNHQIVALNGKTFSQLPTEVQRAVKRFVIQVITLTDYEPQEPNELFFRLNQSYNLTPPEKRNALHGRARDQVRELVQEMISDGLLDRSVIGFSNGRLAYDDIVARVCVAVEYNTLRQHINNAVVEEFYRTREFSEDTIQGVQNSGRLLLAQIADCEGKVKFNKGTLQSWLVYCLWGSSETGALPPGLLSRFDRDRRAIKASEENVFDPLHMFVGEALRIYDDRASYRVTDVSSVRARDLAIHLYSVVEFGSSSRGGSAELVSSMEGRSLAEVSKLLFEFLDQTEWGDPIVPGSVKS